MSQNEETTESKNKHGCLLGCGGSILVLAILWYVVGHVVFESDTGTRLERLIQDAGPQKVRDWAQEQIDAARIARAGKPEQKPEQLAIPPFLAPKNMKRFSRAETMFAIVYPPSDDEGKYYIYIGLYAPVWEQHALYIGEDAVVSKAAGQNRIYSKKFADGIWYADLGGK